MLCLSSFELYSHWVPLKIVHEWNVHLGIFVRPQLIENSRQYLLLRIDISRKLNSRWVPLIQVIVRLF